MNLDLLNEPQRTAVTTADGPLLLLAGAGSGKTRVITHRVAYLMDECSVNPYNILAITFTNKAAKEMRERVDRLIDFGSEGVWISTFHSLCVRILRKHIDKLGMNNDFSIYDTDEQKVVVKDAVKYLKLDPKMYSDRSVLSAISKAKELYISPDDYERENATSFRGQNIANIYREYQKRLKSNNALDFDDLIYMTIFLFETNPDVLEEYQERFRYIMVDEYQDTNYTQFLLIKQLAAKYRNLCVVGDDDQSIYKFRGADITNILNFNEQYPEAKVVKLEENYRSTANILNVANAVVANNENRSDKKLWTSRGEGDKITFTQYLTGYEEGQGVVSKIEKLQENGVSLDDIAVLYRTNNQSRVLEEKLIYTNVPYKLYGGTNFYARKEIRDIVSYMKLLSNPSDDNAVKRIINVPKRGIGDTTVNKAQDFAIENGINLYDALLDVDELPGLARAAEKIKKFTGLIEGLRELLESGESLEYVYDELCARSRYVDELNADGTPESKARVENIQELKNKVVKYEEDAENPTLTELLEEISLVADNDDNGDEDGAAVTLMTLHRAKGLEFPYVFITGFEEGLFPSKMSMDSDDPDDVQEERRLCYVGITRAMKKLYLSAASQRMINGRTEYCRNSRFISEIPNEYLEIEGSFNPGGEHSMSAGSYGGSYGNAYAGYGKSRRTGDSSYASDDDLGGIREMLNRAVKKNKPAVSNGYPGFGKAFPMPNSSNGQPSNMNSTDYKVGDRVRHMKFGPGEVVEVIPAGSDQEITVDFERVGKKKMFASLVKMKKI
jgi:DNA helicase-2/ATP-dependent DNA helicase PcrA